MLSNKLRNESLIRSSCVNSAVVESFVVVEQIFGEYSYSSLTVPSFKFTPLSSSSVSSSSSLKYCSKPGITRSLKAFMLFDPLSVTNRIILSLIPNVLIIS